MEQSQYSETNITSVFTAPEGSTLRSLSPFPILSQMNPIFIYTSYAFMILYNTGKSPTSHKQNHLSSNVRHVIQFRLKH